MQPNPIHKGRDAIVRQNLRLARCLLDRDLNIHERRTLQALTRSHKLSLALGDIQYLNGTWYVSHTGLIRVATRRRCQGICTTLQQAQSDPVSGRWVFKATVYKSRDSRGFVGFGDADPSNTSPLVRGAEMRVAETRAVNRALRKAYGIGLCSVEELGWAPKTTEPGQANQAKPFNARGNGHNGQPRLRDQLCLLIRHYNLDPSLVKAYAAHFFSVGLKSL